MTGPYDNSYGLNYNDGDTSLERIPFTYTSSENDIYHTVIEGETIQSIAYRYYRDSGLWYVIADANSIYNPFEELKEGLQLIIPNGRQQ